MSERIGWRALARYVSGEMTAVEAERVRTWADADPRRRELLETAERAWRAAEPGPVPVHVDDAWHSVASRLDASAPTTQAGVIGISAWRRGRMLRWGLAAAMVVAVAVPLARRQFDASRDAAVHVTGPDEQQTIRLDDGSVVALAPDSRLRIGRDGDREVWLEGTAFFGVAERDGEPFVVHTAAGEAHVLGTRFELRAGPNHVRLTVLEGRVALSGNGGREVARAGQVSVAQVGAPPTPPRDADVDSIVDWMRGILIFQDTPLDQAAREIEREYGVTVRMSDPSLAVRTLTAVFEQQPLTTVVNTICRVVDARCRIEDSSVIVLP